MCGEETYPISISALRDSLNRLVELEEENKEDREEAIKDAITISQLRSEIGRLIEIIKSLGGEW